jgi:hypothetical protein
MATRPPLDFLCLVEAPEPRPLRQTRSADSSFRSRRKQVGETITILTLKLASFDAKIQAKTPRFEDRSLD